MNKLDVALKLLRLLNERKTIDSKIVARELDVSLRTAQRYLIELSILPCVSNKDNNHTYCLNSGYQWNDAIVNARIPDRQDPAQAARLTAAGLGKSICSVCGNDGTTPGKAADMNIFPNSKQVSNMIQIDRLTDLISKRLKNGRCSFP
jgi:hypothetical protein